MKSNPDAARRLFQWTFLPFILYGTLGFLYLFKSNFSWFSWHPLCMVLAFISLAGNACTIKKIGGYENTKTHGILMILACGISGFAWYVIHTQKEILKRQHWLTLHGKLGVGVMVGYFLVGIFGAVALHPDWGIMKTNQSLRFAHKWAGRVLTAAAWASCVLGFNTMYKDPIYQFAFGAPLLVLGYFVLL